jgi:hypothetical protein
MGAKSIFIRSLHEFEKNIKLEKVIDKAGESPNAK